MSEPPALERGYRRLLGWYPRSFRAEQEDEMLAVLTPGNLAIVFGPPLLLVCGVTLTAMRPRRPRAVISAGRRA